MREVEFTDYYEILEISPNASQDTIDKVFRYLAVRYHPDNKDTGDVGRFAKIVQAHDVLREPVKRAQYDIRHKNQFDFRQKLIEEASDQNSIERDAEIQVKLLSLLYVKRRNDTDDPGIGDFELERLLGCPRELLGFHLWYLKEKGWIGLLENGRLAITVEGVDRAQCEHDPQTTTKLLQDRSGRD